MLQSLHIKNFAVVDEAELEPGQGFNVITGETGTGKSLLIGALQLLLGQKASRSMIRPGADRCEISAVLHIPREFVRQRRRVEEFLEQNSLPEEEDGELLVRRTVPANASGGRCFVNGVTVPRRSLAELAGALIDIHGPHQQQSLLQPRYQIELLDAYAGLEEQAEQCGWYYRRARQLRSELQELQQTEQQDDLDLLQHQLREIRDADVQPEEDEELQQRHARMANARRLAEVTEQCRRRLSEDDGAITEQIGTVLRSLGEVIDFDREKLEPLNERLDGVVESLQDIALELENYAEDLEFDAEEFNYLEERIGTLEKLKRKYGPGLEQVLASADDIERRCEAASRRQETAEQKNRELEGVEDKFTEIARELSEKRADVADDLAGRITEKLQNLGFAQSSFGITVEPGESSARGLDRVTFTFCPNPGMQQSPLREIASSGEVARVMLAIKSVLSEADSIPIMVFDEIDANVGGVTAGRVAEELADIGRRHQTICITHLPQIASAGKRHYCVTKSVDNDTTNTDVKLLEDEAREAEIARMLGAEGASHTAHDHAREMLLSAGGKDASEA